MIPEIGLLFLVLAFTISSFYVFGNSFSFYRNNNFIISPKIVYLFFFSVLLSFICLEISFLMDESNINYNEFNRKDLKVYIPSWVYNGNRIWGLTAMITADFLNICFDASINTDLDLIRNYDEY